MCFSASFSFAASGGLTLLGAASYATAPKGRRILVAIPLLFGVQQAFEGTQWLYLNQGSSSPAAAYGFLLFALITWPIYIPWSVFVLDKSSRKEVRWFIALGTLVALYFAGLLLTQPVEVFEHSGSIRYTFGYRGHQLVTPAYLLAVIGPLFISGIRAFRWFGGGIATLAFVAWRLYNLNFISVWCFFSAIVSSMFFAYLLYEKLSRATLPVSRKTPEPNS
jgi:hypothetical protein